MKIYGTVHLKWFSLNKEREGRKGRESKRQNIFRSLSDKTTELNHPPETLPVSTHFIVIKELNNVLLLDEVFYYCSKNYVT